MNNDLTPDEVKATIQVVAALVIILGVAVAFVIYGAAYFVLGPVGLLVAFLVLRLAR